ncbi:MAG TPA: SDR family oxidoreductase [Rhizomicrobium sp.]|jgi:NAD(P)-dependent dehydrogenase (short-subunit alcohol dehydrogenase family)|nr:SDR family oxidoreductase [Rhizomicrobium sp.]
MRGKTIVITGATSGIGEVAAVHLAEQGARIIFTARDEKRGQATRARLNRANGMSDHVVHLADLSLLSEQKRVAAAIAAEPKIDVLINNAGAMFNKRSETADGLEKTFALNHMAYFTVTNLLLDRLRQTPGARIVTVASRAHRGAVLDFGDLQSRHGYQGFGVYAKSKLCNILFNRALAKRLAGTGLTANSLHPGFVATRFGDQSGGMVQRLVAIAKPVGAISPEEGAKTILYLATSSDVASVSGEYFYKCQVTQPTKQAQNDADAERLWQASAMIAGL